jgi:hypothetical protein
MPEALSAQQVATAQALGALGSKRVEAAEQRASPTSAADHDYFVGMGLASVSAWPARWGASMAAMSGSGIVTAAG